jgi:hypothetical protein
MFRSCVVCKVEASSDLHLHFCSACQSALYCSEACQRKDWRKQHNKICKYVNVGHGGMQLRTLIHTSHSVYLKEYIEKVERSMDEEDNRFFILFEESTYEGSQAAARKTTKIAKRETKDIQKFLLFHSLRILARSNSEMFSWPNSPLLVLLHLVGLNVLSRNEHESSQEGEDNVTPLHMLAELADTSDYSTHENQLILAKQLIEHGANIHAVSSPRGESPLHHSCYGCAVTNLDFVELLLKEGADPNAPRPFWKDTANVYRPGGSRCGQISAELAYNGRQYYRSIWSVLPSFGLSRYRACIRPSCRP